MIAIVMMALPTPAAAGTLTLLSEQMPFQYIYTVVPHRAPTGDILLQGRGLTPPDGNYEVTFFVDDGNLAS